MTKKAVIPILAAISCIAVFAAAITIMNMQHTVLKKALPTAGQPHKNDSLVCILDLDTLQNHHNSLYTGYCFDLVCRYMKEAGFVPQIRLADKGESPADSLSAGSAYMICTPSSVIFEGDSVISSAIIDNTFRWHISRSNSADRPKMSRWIAEYNASELRKSLNSRFLNQSSPWLRVASGKRYNHLTPYDSLLKVAADSTGFDWQLLAALFYQESKYHIEAVSATGARGLAQMTPSTAQYLGIENTLDPKENIMAGALYFKKLYNQIYYIQGEDRLKFALAAYNCGLGSLVNGWEYADSLGYDPNSWESVKEALMFRGRDSIPDSADSTLFIANPERCRWTEPVHHVSAVLSYYKAFKSTALN